MGLTLGVLAEAFSHYDKKKHAWINYCDMNQYVYFDVGFDKGVPLGRVVVEVDAKAFKSLGETFIKLARGDYKDSLYGKKLEFTKTSLHYISSTRNLIMGGDVLFNNGCGGCAPTPSGVWEEKNSTSTVDSTRGKVVLLASDTNPNLAASSTVV
ncbi:unnamed protein product [Caenorhabditis bovis]|uniref:Uncharacterized protein n=1 Tax=Caenorhabditis bovis TaxID=2654633 RepID=A0A8S1EEM4_9PELO|nr:unnamed protein product [Caenorhabditis bovis]